MENMDTQRRFAYGCISLGSSALNTLFVTYYLNYFMFVVKVPTRWFYGGQLVFMVWNAVNDPLFGWISDTWRKNTPNRLVRQRLKAVMIGGILWASSFIMMWHTWGSDALAGLHFTVSLCLYDSMLTLVEVNQSALLSDLASDPKERAVMLRWSSGLGCLGTCTSIVGRLCWDQLDMGAFQSMALLVAIFCAAAFAVSYLLLRGAVPKGHDSIDTSYTPVLNELDTTPMLEEDREYPVLGPSQFVQQLYKHRNFRLFVLIAATQQFDCTFEKNFFVFFLDQLAGGGLSTVGHSLVISTSFVLPMLAAAALTGYVQSQGLHVALRTVLAVRLGMAALGLGAVACLGMPRWPLIAFLLANRVVSECCCRLFPLAVSDLTDEDVFLNRRTISMSATIPGAINFFSKPSQALAPMMGLALLGQSLDQGIPSPQAEPRALIWLGYAVTGVPLVCVGLMLTTWRQYSLHGEYHENVASYARNMREMGLSNTKLV